MRAAPLLVLLLALAACGRGDADESHGGLSASQARDLDAAAASIDQNASNGNAQ
jgi:hypothetical protein